MKMYISLRFIGCIEAYLYVYLATFEDKLFLYIWIIRLNDGKMPVNEISKLEC